MKRFLRRSSSADVTGGLDSFQGSRDAGHGRTIGPPLHVLHELGLCSLLRERGIGNAKRIRTCLAHDECEDEGRKDWC